MALRLLEPMLARSGPIPGGAGWTFEPKLDGFRCLVSTHAVFRARSRRGWDITRPLPEFRRIVTAGFSSRAISSRSRRTGKFDFHRLSSRMLKSRIVVASDQAAETEPLFIRAPCHSSTRRLVRNIA